MRKLKCARNQRSDANCGRNILFCSSLRRALFQGMSFTLSLRPLHRLTAIFALHISENRLCISTQTFKAQSAGGKCRRCFAISHRHLLPKPQRISWQSRLLPHYISFVAQHRLSGRAFQKFAFIYHSNLESAICSQAMWVSFASAFNPFHSYSIVPRQSSLSRRFLCSD